MTTLLRTLCSVTKYGLFALLLVVLSLGPLSGAAKGNWALDQAGTPYQNSCDECDGFPGIWREIAADEVPAARRNTPAVWTGTEMLLWGGRDSSGFLDLGYRYNPLTETWTPMSTTNDPEVRVDHSMVWTGTDLIVWGGWTQGDPSSSTKFKKDLGDGARYNLANNTWTPISNTGAPFRRDRHIAVWTGSEMIIWGGRTGGLYDTIWLYDGARYNPSTDTWTNIPPINPYPLIDSAYHVVWTGNELLIWGGSSSSGPINTGIRYNLISNQWTPMSTTGAPAGRINAAAIWTGTEMIIWGGTADGNILNDGARYNPATDTWKPLSSTNAPSGQKEFSTVWTGDEMIIWGGLNADDTTTNEGARYNPATDAWTKTAMLRAPTARWLHTALWTGKEMIIWGGSKNYSIDPQYLLNDGERYSFYQVHSVHLPFLNR